MTKAAVADPDPAIALTVSCPDWSRAIPDVESVVRGAAALALARADLPGAVELSLVLTDDAEVQTLNRDWRGQDKPTNVLSFPQSSLGEQEPAAPGAPVLLGDVIVAYETARGEVDAGLAATLSDHLAHLIVHGVLHLLGHDHEDESEAEEMERLETSLLAELGVPDPYSAHRP
jgi:probable rRNA maturation factor